MFTIFTKDSHKISQKTSRSLSSSWKDSGCHILFGHKHTVRHNLSDVEGESKRKEKRVQCTMWFCLGVSRVGLIERRLCQEHCSYLIPLHSLQGRGDRKTCCKSFLALRTHGCILHDVADLITRCAMHWFLQLTFMTLGNEG